MGTIVGIDLGIITETGLVDIRINTDGKKRTFGCFFLWKGGRVLRTRPPFFTPLLITNDPEESVRS